MPTLTQAYAASALVLASLTAADAQDRSACDGIYCAQGKAASDYAAELTPLMVDPAKTWEEVKGRNVLVIKYYRPDGTFVSTRTWPQTCPAASLSRVPGPRRSCCMG